MLVSAADQKLLTDHKVHIDIDSKEKCGLIRIQNRHFKVTLLTRLSGGDANAWEKQGLAEDQMKETASKVAVMLLKKELIQAQAHASQLSEFKIHNQGFTTNLPNKRTITHEDPIHADKNTRPDYDALMEYLSSVIEDGSEDEKDHDTKPKPLQTGAEEEMDNLYEDELDVQLGIEEEENDLSSFGASKASTSDKTSKSQEKKEEILANKSLAINHSQLQPIKSKGSNKVADTIPRSFFSSIYPSANNNSWLRGMFGLLPESFNFFSSPVVSNLPVNQNSSIKALTLTDSFPRTTSKSMNDEVAKASAKAKQSVDEDEQSTSYDWEAFWNNQRSKQKWDQRRQDEQFERIRRGQPFHATTPLDGRFPPFSFSRKIRQPTPISRPSNPIQSERPSEPLPVANDATRKPFKFPKPIIAPGNEDEIFYYQWKKLQAKRQEGLSATPHVTPLIPVPQNPTPSRESFFGNILNRVTNPLKK